MAEFNPASWYRAVSPTDELLQGDQLFGVTLRLVVPNPTRSGRFAIGEARANVVVATQSCDLAARKVAQVEVVPVHSLARWLSRQPHLFSDLESIRRGHAPGLYLLPGWSESEIPEARVARVVAFDEKLSLPWDQVEAALVRPRLGLRSPYIEHFAQALARFYMRIGLPEDLPEIRWQQLEHESGGRVRTVTPTAEQLAAAGLSSATTALPARVQKVQLVGQPDVLYRALLERDGNYSGVGESEPEAVTSLLRNLAVRRAELQKEPLAEGSKPHWLLVVFPQAQAAHPSR